MIQENGEQGRRKPGKQGSKEGKKQGRKEAGNQGSIEEENQGRKQAGNQRFGGGFHLSGAPYLSAL